MGGRLNLKPLLPGFLHRLTRLPKNLTLQRLPGLCSVLFLVLSFLLIAPSSWAANRIPSLLIKALRAYEVGRVAEAEQFWQQAKAIDARLVRPTWLPSRQEPASNPVKVKEPIEIEGFSLSGIFIRILLLIVLVCLLIWQIWAAVKELSCGKTGNLLPEDNSSDKDETLDSTNLQRDSRELQNRREDLLKSVSKK